MSDIEEIKNQDEYGNPVGNDIDNCQQCGGYGGVIFGRNPNNGEALWKSCDNCSGD